MPLRHTAATIPGPAPVEPGPASRRVDDEAILDAARHLVVSHGLGRTTLTDVAREAGLSRMTVYRRWSGLPELIGRMMQREWDRLLMLDPAILGRRTGRLKSVRELLVEHVVDAARTLRDSELLTSMRARDPELLTPYLVERQGTMHRRAGELIASAVVHGQADRSIRPGDPQRVATAVVLAAQSWVVSMDAAGHGEDPALMDDELRRMLGAYLSPSAEAPAAAPVPAS